LDDIICVINTDTMNTDTMNADTMNADAMNADANVNRVKPVFKIPFLPKKTSDRKQNQIYWNQKKRRFDTWSGTNLLCCHFKQRAMCRDGCGGVFICVHGRRKNTCREEECGNGSSFCEHNKHRQSCRICSPNLYCEHNRQKYNCWDCNPDKFCKHHKRHGKCAKCEES